MTAQIIRRQAIAEQVRAEIVAEVEKLAARGVKPGVATILVGDDGGAQCLPRPDREEHRHGGLCLLQHTLPAGTSQADVLALIAGSTPTPPYTASWPSCRWPARSTRTRCSNAIAPIKDLDCVNPANIVTCLLGDFLFAPADALGLHEILDREGVELQGLDVTIVNHSNIVGKPAALLCSTATPRCTSCTSSARTSPPPVARPTC